MQKKELRWCGGGGPSPDASCCVNGGGGGGDAEQMAAVKARIMSHPLFPQLVAAHLGCLQAAEQLPGGGGLSSTPTGDENHHHPWMIAGAPPLNNPPPAAAAASSTLSENNSAGAGGFSRQPHASAENDHHHHHHDLNHFMVSYISLLQSLKKQLQDNLATQAIEAITTCLEIEQSLYELTGVCVGETTNLQSSGSILSHDIGFFENRHNDSNQHSCNYLYTFDQRYVTINGFPNGIEKALMHHIRKELKKELKEDYGSKLREVRDEIMRKRRTGKLSEETSSVLKDWWNNHERWPYPTEEEKAKLAEESGLELRQINNWFINQRKRIWQLENTMVNDPSTTCSKSHKNERQHFGH